MLSSSTIYFTNMHYLLFFFCFFLSVIRASFRFCDHIWQTTERSGSFGIRPSCWRSALYAVDLYRQLHIRVSILCYRHKTYWRVGRRENDELKKNRKSAKYSVGQKSAWDKFCYEWVGRINKCTPRMSSEIDYREERRWKEDGPGLEHIKTNREE